MLALAASVDEPPVFGKTTEEVAERRRAEKTPGLPSAPGSSPSVATGP
jgi:hypothetical protein